MRPRSLTSLRSLGASGLLAVALAFGCGDDGATFPTGLSDIQDDVAPTDASDVDGRSDGSGDSSGDGGTVACDESCSLGFASIDFGRLGEVDATVTITNVGVGDLSVRELFLEATSPNVVFSTPTIVRVSSEAGWVAEDGDRSFNTDAGAFVLPPGGSEELGLTFLVSAGSTSPECPGQPAAGLNLPCGALVLESDDPATPTLRVPILVSVGGSRMEVEPPRLSFSPPQLIDEAGTRYAEQRRSFTITNAGSTNLELRSATSTNDAVVVDLPSGGLVFPYQLPPGVEQEFSAVWTPRSEAALDGTITISSDASTDGVATISLDSDGSAAPRLDLYPCSFRFASASVGTPTQRQFRVENDGDAPLVWSLSIIGVRPATARTEFVVLDADDELAVGQQVPLDPGQSADLVVQHTPTSEQSVTGELRVTGNFGSPRTCRLSAGPPEPLIEIAPSSLSGSDVAEGDTIERTFVVSNAGQAELNVASIELVGGATGEFALEPDDTGGFTIAPGEARRVGISYTRAVPDSPAPDSATVSLQHDDENAGGASSVRLEVQHDADLVPPRCEVSVEGPPSYAAGDSVVLDATGTAFLAGEPSAVPYAWNLVAPSGSSASFDDEFSAMPTLRFDVTGRYEVGLVATAVSEFGQRTQCELVVPFDVD